VRRLAAVAFLACAIGLWPAAPAAAHPLGNFTVNVAVGVVVRPDSVVVDYVVDMAEIPAFRERRSIDRDLDDLVDEAEADRYRATVCARIASGLALRVDGDALPVEATSSSALAFPPGSGGLATLRLTCRLASGPTSVGAGTRVDVEDRNFPDAIGWREITAVGDRVTIVESDVPETSPSARLADYPADALPPDVRAASLAVTPGGAALGDLPPLGVEASSSRTAGVRDTGVLGSLLGTRTLTPLLVLAMLAIALGVGALHALGPGHGKTLIGAYLVGAGGSLRHAVGVGVAISAMHSASVLALGLVVLSAERAFAPERVYPVLGVASGLVALALGSALLVARIRGRRGHPHDHGHPHPHGHRHGHDHPHTHPHVDGANGAPTPEPLSRRGLVALAFSGGILPSPSALVTLLAAVSLGRTALGLALIAAFSLGLAGALIAVGLVTLRARDVAARRLTAGAARALPVASAGAIVAMGAFLTVQGLLRL
jgi:ABC-type nickel/cobalt efflux system permease component RcnA